MREEKLILKTIDQFSHQHGFPPRISELAERLGVAGDAIAYRQLVGAVESLCRRKRLAVTEWGRVVRSVKQPAIKNRVAKGLAVLGEVG